jgi:hypothetical protein
MYVDRIGQAGVSVMVRAASVGTGIIPIAEYSVIARGTIVLIGTITTVASIGGTYIAIVTFAIHRTETV